MDLTFVHRQGETTPMHRWTPREVDSPDLHVDMETGVITCTSPTATATVAVQIDLGNELARARARGAPPWNTPVNLTHIAGRGFAHMLSEGMRNVLFLPDGFTEADKAAFVAQVQGIVRLLNTNPLTRPFDLLSHRFNYFLAWVPSPQAGVSVLNELVPRPSGGEGGTGGDSVEAANVPLPEPVADPTDPPARLSLRELIDTAAELDARAAAARQALVGARAGLTAALAGSLDGALDGDGSLADAAGLRAALRAAADVGVPGAFPATRHADDPATRAALVDAARVALSELDTRLAAAAGATDAAGVIRAAFGPDLTVVPRFRPGRPDVLGPALAAEPDLGPAPEATVEGWFAQLARVRPPLDAWRDVALYTHALGHGGGRPRIAQLPAGPETRRWAALAYPDEDARPRSGLVSLALLGAQPPTVDEPWSGLLLDSWPELLPSREEDAGLVFQFDAPAAQAPQAVLLAVPPGPEPTWSHDLLERILLDTLDLAKVRALEPADLGAYAQLVPMTFLAANRANATVSTSFAGLLVDDATLTQDG